MRSIDPFLLPAFSRPFTGDQIDPVALHIPLDVSAEWAFGSATGKGVRVAVLDSGVDASHPRVGRVSGYAGVSEEKGQIVIDESPHTDLFGHGTACAGIVRQIAPDCELYSVRVLGERLAGGIKPLLAGLKWCLENEIRVCNLSLGTTKREFTAALHELSDRAYFRNMALVVAANNLAFPSYPSLFAGVISVASHTGTDPNVFYANPNPPVEFGAPGVQIEVAWLDGGTATVTGNSYAAPHMAGHVARILEKHPGLAPAEVKMVLKAIAANASS